MKQKLRTAAGIGLLILAVIGAMLPILQGWMFFLAAVGVLGVDHPIIKWCRRQLNRFGIWKDKDLPSDGQKQA
jgi:uncharacterized membrane protein YbaN (DUF454 family)